MKVELREGPAWIVGPWPPPICRDRTCRFPKSMIHYHPALVRVVK
jgi:hypothetical protein